MPGYEERIHANTVRNIPGIVNYAIDGTVASIRSLKARDRIRLAYPDKEVGSHVCLGLLNSVYMVRPQLKFIIMLRDPVIRMYSHWKYCSDLVAEGKK